MTHEEAIIKANDYIHLVGQRWKHNTDGTIETVIEVKPIELRKVNYGWAVLLSFIPVIENHIAQTRQHFLDSFLNNYTKLE